MFTPVAVYGSGDPMVAAELQRTFARIAALGDPDLARSAHRRSAEALERARETLTLASDLDRVAAAAADGIGED